MRRLPASCPITESFGKVGTLQGLKPSAVPRKNGSEKLSEGKSM